MSGARAEVLERIRAALAGAPPPPARPPNVPEAPPPRDLLALLRDRLRDYGAGVTDLAHDADVGAAVDTAVRRQDVADVVAPAGLPPRWQPRSVPVITDAPPLPAATLAHVGGVVTGCTLAIAETGTLVLTGGGVTEGRRALTLLPDVHVCVVEAALVVATVPQALRRLARASGALTFVSGPSATSDIGFVRVEGVHGPRRLEVVLIAPPPSAATGA